MWFIQIVWQPVLLSILISILAYYGDRYAPHLFVVRHRDP